MGHFGGESVLYVMHGILRVKATNKQIICLFVSVCLSDPQRVVNKTAFRQGQRL